MTSPGPNLALLLLGAYRKLVDAAQAELDARGFADVRSSLHYAMGAIDRGAETASELGRALSVTKQAAAKTIAVLVERGWVAIDDDDVDRRRKRVRLTDLGHRVMREGEAIFDDLRRAWADEVGLDALNRLEAQLAAFVGDATIDLESPGWVAD
ncbi:MarR family transcriptional regulator [Dactylosporangium sp. NPDC051541]|uniref:MarR family transcriptional regulator n=1 Tax=Dactylosporangium sp. NPDC051541 TaxID=3363977 RepID=UPI0037A3BEAF